MFVLLCFFAALAPPAFSIAQPRLTCSQTFLGSVTPLAKPQKATVNIRNIPAGDSVYSNLLIIAQVTGTFSSVVYQIDSGPQYVMSHVGTTNRYQATWDTTTSSPGAHTLYVKAIGSTGKVVGSASVSVTVVTAFKWELYYEIDYVAGHAPSASVLTYIQNYWKGHAVKFNYLLSDVVSDPTPSDGYITDSDFWAIENQYNGVWMYDDRSYGGLVHSSI